MRVAGWSDEEWDEVRSFLRSESTLALATASSEGIPAVAPVFYVLEEAENGDWMLFWLSSPKSLHSQQSAGVVAGTVFAATEDWREIRGLQLRGEVTVVRDSVERQRILEQYARRYRLNALLRLAMAQSTLYCLRPNWLRWIDNGRRFGYKREASGEKA